MTALSTVQWIALAAAFCVLLPLALPKAPEARIPMWIAVVLLSVAVFLLGRR